MYPQKKAAHYQEPNFDGNWFSWNTFKESYKLFERLLTGKTVWIPNKEARIQELETEIKQTKDKINKLESRAQVLKNANGQFKTRIMECIKW